MNVTKKREVVPLAFLLYQFRMSFNRLLDSLRLDADVALRDGCAAVLQQTLDKRNVEAVVLVDLRGVPFAEAVSADALIAEVITDAGKDLLHFPRRDGENQITVSDAVAQTVILDVLLNHERDREDTLLSRLLLDDGQAEASAVVHNVTGTQTHDVADPQAEVPFEHERRGDTLIGTAAAKAFAHGRDDFLVLFRRESGCFLVHFSLQVRIPWRKSSRFERLFDFSTCFLAFGVRISPVIRIIPIQSAEAVIHTVQQQKARAERQAESP